jgi:hypothetical protein
MSSIDIFVKKIAGHEIFCENITFRELYTYEKCELLSQNRYGRMIVMKTAKGRRVLRKRKCLDIFRKKKFRGFSLDLTKFSKIERAISVSILKI